MAPADDRTREDAQIVAFALEVLANDRSHPDDCRAARFLLDVLGRRRPDDGREASAGAPH